MVGLVDRHVVVVVDVRGRFLIFSAANINNGSKIRTSSSIENCVKFSSYNYMNGNTISSSYLWRSLFGGNPSWSDRQTTHVIQRKHPYSGTNSYSNSSIWISFHYPHTPWRRCERPLHSPPLSTHQTFHSPHRCLLAFVAPWCVGLENSSMVHLNARSTQCNIRQPQHRCVAHKFTTIALVRTSPTACPGARLYKWNGHSIINVVRRTISNHFNNNESTSLLALRSVGGHHISLYCRH